MFHAVITFKPDSNGLKTKTRKFDLEFDPKLNENFSKLCEVLETAYWEGIPEPVKNSFGDSLQMNVMNLITLVQCYFF